MHLPWYIIIFFFILMICFIYNFAYFFINAYPFLHVIKKSRYISIILKFVSIQMILTLNSFIGFQYWFFSVFIFLFFDIIVNNIFLNKINSIQEDCFIEYYKMNDYAFIQKNEIFLDTVQKNIKKYSFIYYIGILFFAFIYTSLFNNIGIVIVSLLYQLIIIFIGIKNFWILVYKEMAKKLMFGIIVYVLLSILVVIIAVRFDSMSLTEFSLLIVVPIFSLSNLFSRIFGNYFAFIKLKNFETEYEETSGIIKIQK